jgi:hypothetical protein
MLPSDIFREAAKLIRAGGLSKGANARDADGNEVPLFTNTRGTTEVDESRATVSDKPTQLSLYGALATVMNRNPSNTTRIWTVAADEAMRTMTGKAVPGGTNHLHPVHLLNEYPEIDAEQACAFLERCALLTETPKAEAGAGTHGEQV